MSIVWSKYDTMDKKRNIPKFFREAYVDNSSFLCGIFSRDMVNIKVNNYQKEMAKVAEALGYSKARNAIATHVDSEDKKDTPIQGDLGGIQNMTLINESGL